MWGDPKDIALITAIADDAPVGLWVAHAPGGELIYANNTFAEIMGMGARSDVAVGEYAQPYGIHDRSGALYPEAQMPFVRAMVLKTTVIVDDIVIHRHDGRKVFIRAVAKPTVDERGEVTRVSIAFIDISREVIAEQRREQLVHEVMRTSQQLRDVISAAPIVLFAEDASGTITLAEGKGLEGLGTRPEALVGHNVATLYGELGLPSRRRALAGEQVSDVMDVEGRTFQVFLRPARDDQGSIVGISGVAVDVTDQRRMALQLLQADRMATIGTMAASVAHEINTPVTVLLTALTGMQADLEGLRRKGEASPSPSQLEGLAASLEDARLAADRIRSICRDLTTFARGDEAVRVLDPYLVLEAAWRLVPKHLTQAVSVIRNFGARARVSAQEARLGQVFLNLLINALQSLPETGRRELVLTSRQGEAGGVVLEIADSGSGIPPELRERIFEPFFTTKPAGVGTGLGLSICRNIVRELGGTLVLLPRAGGGSIARLTLPVAPEVAPARSAAPPARPAQRSRVLVIDDDPSLRRVLQLVIGQRHDLTVVSGGREALELLRKGHRYDAIFCDLMMADTSGMELYAAVAKEFPGLEAELTFMTGGAYTPAAEQFLRDVPNVRLQKPFDFDEAIAAARARSTP